MVSTDGGSTTSEWSRLWENCLADNERVVATVDRVPNPSTMRGGVTRATDGVVTTRPRRHRAAGARPCQVE